MHDREFKCALIREQPNICKRTTCARLVITLTANAPVVHSWYAFWQPFFIPTTNFLVKVRRIRVKKTYFKTTFCCCFFFFYLMFMAVGQTTLR